MTGSKTIISILVSVVVIVAAYFAYRLFFPPAVDTAATPGLLAVGSATAAGGTETVTGDEFLTILLSLRSLDFKVEVFDALHQSQLHDFSIALTPQIPGRANPFAPIGSAERLGRPATTTPAP